MTAQAARMESKHDSGQDLDHLRILIVDDAPATREYVRDILEKTGFHHIAEACDGTEALQQVVDFDANFVFLDIQMAPMNGLEFLKKIRSGETSIRRDLPVVVLTMTDDEGILGTAMALDCDAFLNKPTSKTEIGERIWRITSSSPTIRPAIAYKVITIPDLDYATADKPPVFDEHYLRSKTEEVLALKAGCVLQEDIRTAAGNLLLVAGTKLTQQYIHRLADIAQFSFIMLSKGGDRHS